MIDSEWSDHICTQLNWRSSSVGLGSEEGMWKLGERKDCRGGFGAGLSAEGNLSLIISTH